MPDTNDAHSQGTPAAGAAGDSGCVLFLIDESKAMDARVAGGTKSKAESIATALNSLLNQLTAGPAMDVAVVGYRAARPGGDDVGPRWGGTLAGRPFVPTSELAGAPLTVETRVRKVPGSGGIGVAREESVRFPVWYVPRLGDAASRTAAFEHCRGMLSEWVSAAGGGCKPPMLVSFIGELDAQETPEAVGKAIHQIETPGGPPWIVHAHLSSSDRIPATIYPSSDTHLAPGPVRLLFEASSVLPDEFRGSLRQLQVNVNAGARGLIYNARMVDLIRLLSLVKAYARYQRPPPAPPAAPSAAPGPSAESFSTDVLAATSGAADAATGDESITIGPTGEVTVAGLPSTPGPDAKGLAPESLTVQMPAPDAPTAQFSSAEFAAGATATEGLARADASAAAESPSPTHAEETSEKPEAPQPAHEAPTPTSAESAASAAEQRALVVLLLDRSVENPTVGSRHTVWGRLQQHANDLLGQISKRGKGDVDVALVSYGCARDAGGNSIPDVVEVENRFSGPLAGATVASDTELARAAIRTEEVAEKVSNGIGGLVEVTRKRPVFVDLVPTMTVVSPTPAFDAVRELVAQRRKGRPGGAVSSVVLHMTRGRFEPGQIQRAAGQLLELPGVALYHWVLTESPHPSVAYPAEPTNIREAALVKLWELTSPLLGSQSLAAGKPAVTPESRGIVINGKFDLFVVGIVEALTAPGAE